MDDHRSFFSDRLRERGLRVTPERLAILGQALHLRGHFDADDLHEALRAGGSAISRATVYRTLAHLVDTSLLRRHVLPGRPALYELDLGRTHHEHLLCVECGTILEFVDAEIERRQDRVCRRLHFRPLGHSLQIHGVCSRCGRLRGNGGQSCGSGP